MDERSVAQERRKGCATFARTVRVDERLLEEISELTGISLWPLSSAFLGFPPEPKHEAIDIVKADP